MREGNNALAYWTGPDSPPLNQMPLALATSVSPDYLKVMGIPLRQGRFFDDQDRIGNQLVVVIDDVLAQHAFPGEQAVGKRLWIRAIPWGTAGPAPVGGGPRPDRGRGGTRAALGAGGRRFCPGTGSVLLSVCPGSGPPDAPVVRADVGRGPHKPPALDYGPVVAADSARSGRRPGPLPDSDCGAAGQRLARSAALPPIAFRYLRRCGLVAGLHRHLRSA